MKTKKVKFDCLKNMPPLHHGRKDEEFDIMKSEVVDWMMQQPEIRQWLYNKTCGARIEGVKYDPENGTWQGVDYNA